MKRRSKITALILSFMICMSVVSQGTFVFAAQSDISDDISAQQDTDLMQEKSTAEESDEKETAPEDIGLNLQQKKEEEKSPEVKTPSLKEDKTKSISETKKTKAVKTVGGTSLSDWDYTDNGSEIVLNKYKGTSMSVEIPSVLDGKKVKIKSLQNGGLFNNKSLESIIIGDPSNRVALEDCSLKYAFSGFTKLRAADLSGLDTSNVTDMHGMFY